MPIMNGNAVAFMTAVLAFAAWCRLLRPGSVRRVFWLLVLGSALGMLILSQSRTSLIGLIVAIVLQLFFDRRFGLLLLLSILAALVAASAQISTVTEEYLVRGQSRELVSSLSGRTQGWEVAWASFQQSPVIGRGFAAAARAEILGTTGASTLHGAVFDVLVGVGLLGFIPWAAAILWTIVQLLGLGRRGLSRRRVGNLDRSATAEMLGLLALIIVRSTTNSDLALHEHTFMLFLTVLAFTTAARSLGRRLTAAVSERSQELSGARTNPSRQPGASVEA